MKRLGPYKKYIIAAAVIQSVMVVFVGYFFFKSKRMKAPIKQKMLGKIGVEQPLKRNN